MASTLLAPVFMQAFLSFGLMFWMLLARSKAAKPSPELVQKSAIDSKVWPEKAQQIANNYSNQFEMPVLFYAVIAFAILLGKESNLLVWLAWLFVATRIVHSLLHTGPNIVMHRFYAFLGGVFCLIIMWGKLAVDLYM